MFQNEDYPKPYLIAETQDTVRYPCRPRLRSLSRLSYSGIEGGFPLSEKIHEWQFVQPSLSDAVENQEQYFCENTGTASSSSLPSSDLISSFHTSGGVNDDVEGNPMSAIEPSTLETHEGPLSTKGV